MVKKEEAAREPVAASDVWGCVYNYFFMCGLFRLLTDYKPAASSAVRSRTHRTTLMLPIT